MVRSRASSASAAGTSRIKDWSHMCHRHHARQHATCSTFRFQLFQNLLRLLKITLFSQCFTFPEHRFIVLAILSESLEIGIQSMDLIHRLSKYLVRGFNGTFPISLFDMTRGHVSVDFRYRFVNLHAVECRVRKNNMTDLRLLFGFSCARFCGRDSFEPFIGRPWVT